MSNQLQKMDETKIATISGAQLMKLDPSIPYLIILPEKESGIANELVSFLGKANVLASVIVGDASRFKIFGSISWGVTKKASKKRPATKKAAKKSIVDRIRTGSK